MKRTAKNGAPPAAPVIRCAVYTRKRTEEGLEQEFNSLDAQREAGENYIKSQAGEGWSLLSTRYDDGGERQNSDMAQFFVRKTTAGFSVCAMADLMLPVHAPAMHRFGDICAPTFTGSRIVAPWAWGRQARQLGSLLDNRHPFHITNGTGSRKACCSYRLATPDQPMCWETNTTST